MDERKVTDLLDDVWPPAWLRPAPVESLLVKCHPAFKTQIVIWSWILALVSPGRYRADVGNGWDAQLCDVFYRPVVMTEPVRMIAPVRASSAKARHAWRNVVRKRVWSHPVEVLGVSRQKTFEGLFEERRAVDRGVRIRRRCDRRRGRRGKSGDGQVLSCFR